MPFPNRGFPAAPFGGDRLPQNSGRIVPPRGFRWGAPPINFWRRGEDIITDFDIRSLTPSVGVTYYLNPNSGSDAAAGTSEGTALKKLSTALAKPDVDQVIMMLSNHYVARTSDGWNNVQPTRSVSVINDTGYRFIAPITASSVAPVWSAHGTYPFVYKATITSANASNVTDFAPWLDESLIYVNRYGDSRKMPGMSGMRAFNTLTKVGSEAEVADTPGSWFHNGTEVVVRALDSRNLIGDTYLQPTSNSNSGRFPATINNCTIFVRGIDFVGGRPWYSFVASNITGTKLVMEKCSFQGANVVGGSNGLNISAFQDVYLKDCLAWKNGADGLNYHSNESDGTTQNTSPGFIELDCMVGYSGTTGSAQVSDNASTSHDFANGIRKGGVYLNSSDRVLAETNSAHTWNLGCYVGQATTEAAGKESIASIGTASKMWLDTCYAKPGNNPRWIATSGAQLYHYNSGPVTNAGTGEATGSVQSYTPSGVA